MKPLLALLPVLFPAVLAAGGETPLKGIDISLVSENAAVAAGEAFTVGVKVHHHEGFHTYWQNPGVAGVPVKLEWHLPEGFAAGPIQWPYPEKTMMAIHPVHGFERDVMLLVEITPPAEIPARVKLAATASWMACADGCYPGKKELSIELPSAEEEKVDPVMGAEFSRARAEIPAPLRHWKVNLLSKPDAPEIRFRLTPADDQALEPENLYFFSSDGQVSSDPPQRVEKMDGGVFEIIAPRSPYGPDGKEGLPGVIVSSTPFSKGGPVFASIGIPADVASSAPAEVEKCECESE